MNGFDSIMLEVAAELRSAKQKFPEWPHDMVHGAAIVAEESGELQQACLQAAYEQGPREKAHTEAIHTAAMAIRFLMNFDRMNNTPSQQFVE